MNTRVFSVCLLLSATCAVSAAPAAGAVLNFANQAQGPGGREWRWKER